MKAAALRLERQHLSKRVPVTSLPKVVADLCGVDAEDASATHLTLWSRTKGLRRRALEAALGDRRTLVKTWLYRGRLHIVAAADLGMALAALRDDAEQRLRAELEDRGVDWDAVETITDAAGEALRGAWLSPKELAMIVGRTAGPKAGEMLRFGWADLLRPAAARGLVCFGPARGNEPTFVRPDEWIDGYAEPYPSEGRAQLVRRYLRTFGPATAADVEAWSGIGRADIKIALDELPVAEVGDAFVLRRDQKAAAKTGEDVRLVGNHDPYLRAYASTDHALEPNRRRSLGGKGAVLHRGRVIGCWDPERHGGRMVVRIRLWGKVTKVQCEAISDQADEAGRFLGAAACDVEFTK